MPEPLQDVTLSDTTNTLRKQLVYWLEKEGQYESRDSPPGFEQCTSPGYQNKLLPLLSALKGDTALKWAPPEMTGGIVRPEDPKVGGPLFNRTRDKYLVLLSDNPEPPMISRDGKSWKHLEPGTAIYCAAESYVSIKGNALVLVVTWPQ